MSRLLPLLILLQSMHSAFGQTTPLSQLSDEQLAQTLRQSAQDSDRVNIQLLVGKERLLNSADQQAKFKSSFQLATNAITLSRKIGYTRGEGNALLLFAIYYSVKGRKDTAMILAKSALHLFQNTTDTLGIGDADVIVGQQYDVNSDERIAYYRAAVSLFLRARNKIRAATTLVDIADLLVARGMYSEAPSPLHDALSIFQTAGYRDLQGVYLLLCKVALEKSDYVSATKYGLSAIRTAETNGDSSLQLCAIYCSMASVYNLTKNYYLSDSLSQKAMAIAKRYNDSNYMADVASDWSTTCRWRGKYEESIALVKNYVEPTTRPGDLVSWVQIYEEYLHDHLGLKRYELAKDDMLKMRQAANNLNPHSVWATVTDRVTSEYFEATGNYTAAYSLLRPLERWYEQDHQTEMQGIVEDLLYRADSATGNYFSAMAHLKKYLTLRDSIMNREKSQQIESLRIDNETDKKDRDLLVKDQRIQLLNEQSKLKNSQLRESRSALNMFIGGSALLVIIILLGYSRFRVKQQSNQRLQMQQKEITDQNQALQTLLTDKSELLQDKDLLLREVHHRVKNNLHLVMSLLESQSTYLESKPAQTAIENSLSRIQAIALIHQRLYGAETVSSIDMHLYIPELIEYLVQCHGTRQKGILVRQLIDPIKLDVSQAIPLGIILNEIITNAIKHAFPDQRPGSILVRLQQLPENNILLEISDDGIGSPTQQQNTGSMGMILIRGLSRQLGGTLSMERDNGYRIAIFFEPITPDVFKAE